MRKKFVAGNWKMNLNKSDSVKLVLELKKLLQEAKISEVDVAVCPPFVYLAAVAEALANSTIGLGAQDVFYEGNGAFTGEISVAMLNDMCCRYAILGHSERRHIIGENDALINRKLHAVLAGGLLPIFCIGELLQEREQNQTEAVIERQLRQGLTGITKEQAPLITIAYEPVWAIGTGKTATPAQAQEAHAFSRKILTSLFGADIAQKMRIQYGGSVKASNAAELMGQPDVDGALVGGASLKADEFLGIIKGSQRQ